MKSFISALALLLMVLSARAATTFVSTTGSNANACGAGAGSPKLTVAACAACNTTPGDICQIEGGPSAAAPFVYTADVDDTSTTLVSGTSGSPMVLKVTPGEFVVIRPSSTTCHVLNLRTTSHWTIDGNSSGTNRDGLILDGLNNGCGSTSASIFHQGSLSTGIWLKNLTLYRSRNSGTTYSIPISGQSAVADTAVGSNLRVSNVLVDYDFPSGATLGSHGVYVQQFSGGTWIEDSEVANTAAVGVQFNHGGGAVAHGNCVVERTSIHDFGKLSTATKIGLVLNSNQAGCIVRNNLIYNGVGPGIAAYGQRAADHEIYNNTVSKVTGAGIALGTFTDLKTTATRNNLLFDNGECIHVYASANDTGDGNTVTKNLCWKASGAYSTPVVVAGSSGDVTVSGTINGNPLLSNAGAVPPNLHLLTGSAAIDAGDTLAEVTDDYDGTTRSGTNDVGAYNFGTTVSPNHLAFLTPPVSGTIVGAQLPDVVVEILDAVNARQTGDTGNCVAAKATGTGTLGGTLTRAVSSGLCTFDDLTFDAADTDFSITVTKSGGTAATEVTSLEFSVIAAPSGQGSPTLILRQY